MMHFVYLDVWSKTEILFQVAEQSKQNCLLDLVKEPKKLVVLMVIVFR